MQPSTCCSSDHKCPKSPLAPTDFGTRYNGNMAIARIRISLVYPAEVTGCYFVCRNGVRNDRRPEWFAVSCRQAVEHCEVISRVSSSTVVRLVQRINVQYCGNSVRLSYSRHGPATVAVWVLCNQLYQCSGLRSFRQIGQSKQVCWYHDSCFLDSAYDGFFMCSVIWHCFHI